VKKLTKAKFLLYFSGLMMSYIANYFLRLNDKMIVLIPELIPSNPLIPLTLHNISGDWQARSNPYKRGSFGYHIFEPSIALFNLNLVLNMEIGKQEAIRTNGEPAATTSLSLKWLYLL
jgi:hypothetical protein